jgi:hypothetical protein
MDGHHDDELHGRQRGRPQGRLETRSPQSLRGRLQGAPRLGGFQRPPLLPGGSRLRERFRSIRRRLLDGVDDEELDRATLRFKLQSQLFLQSSKDREGVIHSCAVGRRRLGIMRRAQKFKIVCAGQTSAIEVSLARSPVLCQFRHPDISHQSCVEDAGRSRSR